MTPVFRGDRVFDLETIKRQLAGAEVQQRDDGEFEKAIYLGSVLNLTPSRKLYAPFACSNLAPCPWCHGRGQVPNPRRQVTRSKRAHRKASRLRTMAIRDYGFWCEGRWPDRIHQRLRRLDALVERYAAVLTCPLCHGLGSREAWFDQQWREQAERELRSIGAFLFNSEADPCDLMAGVMVDGPVGEPEWKEERDALPATA